MTLIITHPNGHTAVLPRLTGIAVSSDRTLLLVLPNGTLVKRGSDRWKNFEVRAHDEPIPSVVQEKTDGN